MPTETFGNNTTNDYAGAQDTFLREDVSVLNYGSETYFEVSKSSAGTHRNALLGFSSLSNIPSTATVTDATLYLYLGNWNSAGVTMDLYRMIQSWGETTATWDDYDGTNPWNTAGALGSGTDYDSTISVQLAITNVAEYKAFTSAQLIQDIQDIVSGTNTNNGWLLFRDGTGNDGEYHSFTSKEGTDGQRPYLSVTYTVSAGNTITPTSGLMVTVSNGQILAQGAGASITAPQTGNFSTSGNVATVQSQAGENETSPTVSLLTTVGGVSVVTGIYRQPVDINLVLTVTGNMRQLNQRTPVIGTVEIASEAPTVTLVVETLPQTGSVSVTGRAADINNITATVVLPSGYLITVTENTPTVSTSGQITPAVGVMTVSSTPMIIDHGVFIFPTGGTMQTIPQSGIQYDHRTWVVVPRATSTWTH